MEKPFACFELASDCIKLLIAYEFEGKPVVMYRARKEFSGLIQDGRIVDKEGLIAALQQFTSIADDDARIRIDIHEAVFLLPPLGLRVFQLSDNTSGVSPDNSISKVDISNVVSMVKKKANVSEKEIIDIIPDEFILEDGSTYASAKDILGKKSRTLGIKAKLHVMPEEMAGNLRYCAQRAGIYVKKIALTPYCEAMLFALDENLPTNYLLLDIGKDMSELSLIGKSSLYASSYIPLGGGELSEQIAGAFSLTKEKAEEIKCQFGYQDRFISYDPPLAEGNELNGAKAHVYQKDLNAAIESYFENYFGILSPAINALLSKYNGRFDEFPILLTGGGSKLNGIKPFFEKAFPKRPIYVARASVIGARDPSYAGLLGLSLASSRYTGSLEDNLRGMASVSRVSKAKEKRNKEEEEGK